MQPLGATLFEDNNNNNNYNLLLDAERAGSAHSGRIRNFETCRKPAPPLVADLPTSSEKEKRSLSKKLTKRRA